MLFYFYFFSFYSKEPTLEKYYMLKLNRQCCRIPSAWARGNTCETERQWGVWMNRCNLRGGLGEWHAKRIGGQRGGEGRRHRCEEMWLPLAPLASCNRTFGRRTNDIPNSYVFHFLFLFFSVLATRATRCSWTK